MSKKEFPRLTLRDSNNDLFVFPDKNEAMLYASLLQEQNMDTIWFVNINESFSVNGGIFYTIVPITYPDENNKVELKYPSMEVMSAIAVELKEIRDREAAEVEATKPKIFKP